MDEHTWLLGTIRSQGYTDCTGDVSFPVKQIESSEPTIVINLPSHLHSLRMLDNSSWATSTPCSTPGSFSGSQFQDLWSDPVDCRSCLLCQNEKCSIEAISRHSTQPAITGRYPVKTQTRDGGLVLDEPIYDTSQLNAWNVQDFSRDRCRSSICANGAHADQNTHNFAGIWSNDNLNEANRGFYTSNEGIPSGSQPANNTSLESFSDLSIHSQTNRCLNYRPDEKGYFPYTCNYKNMGPWQITETELADEPKQNVASDLIVQSESSLAMEHHVNPIIANSCLDEASNVSVSISDESDYMQSLVDDEKYRNERSIEAEYDTMSCCDTPSSDNTQNGGQEQGSPQDSPHESTGESIQERDMMDNFLVQQKESGKTYKQIRKEGGFKVSESTLRGRYRNLTKKKEARVRKPIWKKRDVSLGFQN